MSDPVTITTLILAAIPTTIASVLAAVLTYLSFKKNTAVATLAVKTHDLVNGSMLVQLKLHANTSRALANITRHTEHEEIALLAEKLLKEHQEKLSLIEGATAK